MKLMTTLFVGILSLGFWVDTSCARARSEVTGVSILTSNPEEQATKIEDTTTSKEYYHFIAGCSSFIVKDPDILKNPNQRVTIFIDQKQDENGKPVRPGVVVCTVEKGSL